MNELYDFSVALPPAFPDARLVVAIKLSQNSSPTRRKVMTKCRSSSPTHGWRRRWRVPGWG
ncbi:hypothetical protein KHC28_01120 [Ancylobacter sonchi]|uniref:hypothetical protein n=1 Tax=Ancylobacter sonchi TaxID=1937790 RepID=UPI001BD6D7E3|nr:hypothetical protein [Ancylobacter sonchi]MBS7532266.1 hypothetical protein [Ancylobacter sonchi]